jgi:hypothetical protein
MLIQVNIRTNEHFPLRIERDFIMTDTVTDFLKNTLKERILEVTFTKKDGTERVMKCTLRPDLLPAQTDLEEQVQNRKSNPDVLAVWDLEAKGWRSFRHDSIMMFTYVEEAFA